MSHSADSTAAPPGLSTAASRPGVPAGSEPHLRRVLSLWDLIIYGIIAVTPCAPITVFGLTEERSKGHGVDTILLAMIAMMLTAVSCGRLAAIYPSAGSAHTYVGRGINSHLGFLAGWTMPLDYIVIPLFCTLFGALTLQRLAPEIPFAVLAALFAASVTGLNLRGIRTTARANQVLLVIMMGVLLAFVVLAVRHLFARDGWGGVLSTVPFYNPATFSFLAIQSATAFAALTYTGFDAITTLAEEVKNPRRNVLLAMVLVCLYTGLFGGLLVYLGQRVWPDFAIYRLYFVGVEGHQRHFFADAVAPAVGFMFCFWIWYNLATPAKIVGGLWLVGGVVLLACKTRGFRIKSVQIDFSET